MDRTRFQWLVGFALLWIVVWALAFRFDLNLSADENKKKIDLLKRKLSDSAAVINTAGFEQLVSLPVETGTESIGIQTL